jgi:hypothetical protein
MVELWCRRPACRGQPRWLHDKFEHRKLGHRRSGSRTEAGQEFAHLTGRVGIALATRLLDAVAKHGAGVIRSPKLGELLSRHEEGRNVRRIVGHQATVLFETAFMLALFSQLHGQTIP